MKNSRKGRLYRQLLTATLLFGGTFNLVAPAMALGTAAGVSISNTATGTYTDSTSGESIKATSNTVSITVAEVAGIDVGAVSQNPTGNPGDVINYVFKITNTGNAATKFVLPTSAQLSGDVVTGSTVESITYSTNETFAANNTNIPVNGTPVTTGSIAADGVVYVKVAVKVASTAQAGQKLIVKYGDTTDPSATNQERTTATSSANDVYTQDADATAAPINGVREDSASIEASVGMVGNVLNGPKNHPEATGDGTNTNTDFTNASSKITENIAPGKTDYNPAPLTFTNTVQNTSNATADIYLQPNALLAGMQLPNNTTVTIKDPAGVATATYTWDGSTFSTATPVKFSVPAGRTAQYEVTVDLPAGTPLSTNLTFDPSRPGDLTAATAVGGYSVPITAYADTNGNGIDPTDATNTTIDRTYVGYLAMYKDARILAANGTTELVPFTQVSADLSAKAAPGNIIEYRIQYKNISENAAATTSSGIATAKNVEIIEDGSAGGNNWATTTTNKPSSDTFATGTTVDYFNGGTSATRTDEVISKYVNKVGDVAPQTLGKFTIQRTVKDK